jgi:hypothetical protein
MQRVGRDADRRAIRGSKNLGIRVALAAASQIPDVTNQSSEREIFSACAGRNLPQFVHLRNLRGGVSGGSRWKSSAKGKDYG